MRTISTLVLLGLLLWIPPYGWTLDGQSILALKQAGLSEETIQLVMQEKIVETGAFTVQEIIAFKTAGLAEETIQRIIKDGSFMSDTTTIVYGRDTKPLEMTSAKDIIALKKAGISEAVIQAIIIYRSRAAGDEERADAWKMLQRMGIIIDQR